MLFSHRMGLKPIKTGIQVNAIDQDLRNCLWNALSTFYWNLMRDNLISNHTEMDILFKRIWHDHFKRPIDTLSNYWPETYKEIRGLFFSCLWYDVYDIIEFIANNYPDSYDSVNREFMKFCNSILERELSAYRFVGGKITPITSQEEISEIEEVLEATKPLKTVNIHLRTALQLLADRKAPDYRNSIKESISAVEAVCKIITKEESTTLGQALNRIENTLGLSPALKSAFSNLYGYTSGEEGIRHALLDEPNLGFEDAKFMLVACSAFVNYLIAKSSKAGIKL
jgi:hypothetical protein